jgi:aldose 1-epimerase
MVNLRKFPRKVVLQGSWLLAACGGAQPSPEPPPASAQVIGAPVQAGATAAEKPAPPTPKPAAIAKTPYGNVDGKPVSLYTLTSARGLVLKVTDYGTIITELDVPDKAGTLADVVLGFDTLEGYQQQSPYFGATVGRVANRIRDAKFQLEGKAYQLVPNNKPHHLHGGQKGWDKVVWNAEPVETPEGPSIKFTYVSKDGEEGYPGTVTAHTTYTLTNANELRVEMDAVTDKTTIVNMAHHTYWNLGGHASGPITAQELTLFADEYTPGNPSVPTGVVKPVKGTPFDFSAPKAIGRDLKEAGGNPVGFDHNFVVKGAAEELRPVAKLRDPKSGRVMTLEADQPGVQVYTGNYLDGSIKGKGGVTYAQYAGVCLETQKFPNSINVPAWKGQVILKPGASYRHRMIHRFSSD